MRANDANQERILRSLGVTDILRRSEVAEVVSERLINPNIRGFLTLRTTTKSQKSRPRGVSRTSLGGPGFGQPLRVALITIRREFEETGDDGALRGNTSRVPKPDTIEAMGSQGVWLPGAVRAFGHQRLISWRTWPLNPAATPFPLPPA